MEEKQIEHIDYFGLSNPVQEEPELTQQENEAIDKETMAEIFSEVLKGKRPEGMPYEMYKQIRTLQNKKIHERKQGNVIWPAQYKHEVKVGEKTEERWYKNRTPFVKSQYEAFVKQEQQKEIDRINEQNKLLNNAEDKPQNEVK